jgi:cell division protease FtsH
MFGHLSTGAADDLAKVTNIARSMALRYGMVEKIGPVSLDEPRPGFLEAPYPFQPRREYSEETAREIDVAVHDIVERAFEKAVSILERERATLERGARMLLEKETLAEEELAQLKAALGTQNPAEPSATGPSRTIR